MLRVTPRLRGARCPGGRVMGPVTEGRMCSGPMRSAVLYGSLRAMARSSARLFGDAPAIIDGDLVLSFNDVVAIMRRVAASLISRGVGRGDRIGLWAPN